MALGGGGPGTGRRRESGDVNRFEELGRGSRRWEAPSQLWLATVTLIYLSSAGLGNLVFGRWTPVIQADVAWPLRMVIKLFSFSGELIAMFLPKTALSLFVLFAVAWATQLGVGTVTFVLQRENAVELARRRGVTLSEAMAVVGRPALRQRFREAASLGRTMLKASVLFCVVGAILGLIGWMLVLLANSSENSVFHTTVAVLAIPLLILLAWFVGRLQNRLVGVEDADEPGGPPRQT